jgi:hypothetical protein
LPGDQSTVANGLSLALMHLAVAAVLIPGLAATAPSRARPGPTREQEEQAIDRTHNTGKLGIVTGAGSGIGRATVLRLAVCPRTPSHVVRRTA